MTNTVNSALARAFLRIFRPLARILIRNGISYPAMSDWAKKVYVDVAFEEFAEPGKKQTISRVSALTGLFRREVKRLHELDLEEDLPAGDRYNRAVRVISGWLNDTEFQTPTGKPASLTFEGETRSFTALARAYSGDIPARAMLTVLESADCIEETDSGKLRLIRHMYIPAGDSADKLHILGVDVAELVGTIDHNIKADPAERFFQRKVSNTRLDPAAVEAFRKFSRDKSQALLEELDAWLSDHEINEPDSGEAGQYVSLGIYYSQGPGGKEE
jgi:hypothetical protein